MADGILEQLTASNMFDLRNVVAVVTGGGTGIGLMISTTLTANGAKVYIIGPDQAKLEQITTVYNDAAQKTNKPGRMFGLQGDISRKSEALRLAQEVGKREEHITVLFNNAGVLAGKFSSPGTNSAEAFRAAYFDTATEDDFDVSMRTNAAGPYWLTFAFLPLLEKWKKYQGGTRQFAPQIIMTSSMNGWTKDARTSGCSFPYMFSKSAIGQATSSLAHELLPLGIRVNGIAPGLFPSEMSAPGTINAIGQSHLTDKVYHPFEVPADSDDDGRRSRGGTNRDMGSLVLFLVANWFVNGETVLIDGGTLLKHPSSY
ncbi:NAD(P)-binding protein [Wolfiporia cocos MD-104 SS10]|uniref:NAD(P)-binding protein n=1 Tax=Wolfiporia cocos (strain MD-104) TaxID=742152 RepID=A0A2H3J8E4_WOLCO|nr:NAD(P)-binding protein [Wolfiporia cocos MD-104 SS10]